MDLPFPLQLGSLPVDVLDAKKELAPGRAGEVMGDQRGIGMAQVQRPRGRGGEAGADDHSAACALA